MSGAHFVRRFHDNSETSAFGLNDVIVGNDQQVPILGYGEQSIAIRASRFFNI